MGSGQESMSAGEATGGMLPLAPSPARIPLLCLGLFFAVAVPLAIHPHDRPTWVLENLPTLGFLLTLIITWPRFRFSNAAYIQGLIFLVLHSIGSHYTYSLVPFGEWVRDELGFARNHYDRVVHFAFGLLAFRATRELTFRRAKASLFAQVALTVCVIAAYSLLYELVEWWVALIVAPEEGSAFLATQGDEWDAQQDMGMACIGAMISGSYALLHALSPRPR